MSTLPGAPFEILLASLVDDAALFRPERAGMSAALDAHVAHRGAPYGDIIGSFRCPVTRLAELSARLAPNASLRLAVVLDTGPAGLAAARSAVERDRRLTLAAVETSLPRDGEAAVTAKHYAAALDALSSEAAPDVASFVDVPVDAGWEGVLDALAETGSNAKLPTPVLSGDAHGSLTQMASLLRGCVDRQLAFTCSTGLNDPVSGAHDGSERHGFLNLLAATAAALDGAEADELAELLDARDGPALLTRLGAMGEPEAEVTRGFFRSFGSSHVGEPVAGLRALGVVP